MCVSMHRYEVRGCEVVWAIKDKSISHSFFDEGAATFFLPHLVSEATDSGGLADEAGGLVEIRPLKRRRYTLDEKSEGSGKMETVGGAVGGAMGGALGPDWHSSLEMTGKAHDKVSKCHVMFTVVM